ATPTAWRPTTSSWSGRAPSPRRPAGRSRATPAARPTSTGPCPGPTRPPPGDTRSGAPPGRPAPRAPARPSRPRPPDGGAVAPRRPPATDPARPAPVLPRTPVPKTPENDRPHPSDQPVPTTVDDVREWLVAAVAEAAGVDPGTVDPDRPIAELGLGSRQLVT